MSQGGHVSPELVLLVAGRLLGFFPFEVLHGHIVCEAKLLISEWQHLMQLEVLNLILDEVAPRADHLIVVEVQKQWETLLLTQLATQVFVHVVNLRFHTGPRPKIESQALHRIINLT